MGQPNDHLALAKTYLAIAESGDAKREAYRKAAEELAAYKTESGCNYAELGRLVGKKAAYVSTLVKWYDTGCKAETPFLADTEATTRAARSHARKLLSDPEEAESLLSDPRVLDAVSSNPKTAAALVRAAGEVGDRVEQTERARYRERNPQHARSHELLTLMSRLQNSRAGVVKSVEELMDLALTEDEREKVLPCAERLSSASDMLVALLSGEGINFDELLREEV